MTVCCADDLNVIEVLTSSDEALPKLAARLAQSPEAARQPPAPPCPVPPPPREPVRRPRSRSRQTSSAAPSPSPSPEPTSLLATVQATAVAEAHGRSSDDSLPQPQHASVPDRHHADARPSGQRGGSGGDPRPDEAPPTPEHPQPLPAAEDDARVHIWRWDGARTVSVNGPRCGDGAVGAGLAERVSCDGCKPSAAAGADSAQNALGTISGLQQSMAAAGAVHPAAATGMEAAAAASTDCRLLKEVPMGAPPLLHPLAANDAANSGDMKACAFGKAAAEVPLLMGMDVSSVSTDGAKEDLVGCAPELDKHCLTPAGPLPAG